jgi:hypothetical protein
MFVLKKFFEISIAVKIINFEARRIDAPWYMIPPHSVSSIKLSSGYNLALDAALLIRLNDA